MSYDFSSLSHPDFESLCLYLVGAYAGLDLRRLARDRTVALTDGTPRPMK